MREHSVVRFRKPEAVRNALSALVREGAQRLIAQEVQVELEEFLCRFAGHQDDSGRSVVVRNGYQPERSILTGIGPIAVRVPKVRSRTQAGAVFRSALVPSYVRRARAVEASRRQLAPHAARSSLAYSAAVSR